MRIPQYPAVVAHQQWLKGERDGLVAIDSDLLRLRAAMMDEEFHRNVSDLFALEQYDSGDHQPEQDKASSLLAANAFAGSGDATVKKLLQAKSKPSARSHRQITLKRFVYIMPAGGGPP
jgi:hypothetical protein